MNRSMSVKLCRFLSKMFEVDLVVKLFGVTILHLHFPPHSTGVESEDLDIDVDLSNLKN